MNRLFLETVEPQAEARDEDGKVVAAPSLTWTSSITNVASVNSSSRMIANAVGTAVISLAAACCSGDQVSISVTSVTQEVASVQVSPTSASMEPGATRQFTAEARDANGNGISGMEFDWSSTQSTVASVNSSGVVSAHSDGSAGIRATASSVIGQASLSVGTTSGGGSSPFPNEPSGYVTIFNDGFDYPGVTIRDPWFDVDGSNLGGRFNHGGRPSIARANNGQPESPDAAYRAFYPGGMPGGHDAARLAIPLSSSAPGGFYLAYTVRLPEEWHTTANDLYNGIKHVIPWVNPADGSDPRPLGWTVLAQDGGARSGNNRYRVAYTLENIPPETFRRRDIPFVDEAAAVIDKGQWATIELAVRFDSSGPNTGRIDLWVNGVLVAQELNAPIPVANLRNVTIAGTYGGGVGDVPHDMWYDVGHVYVSRPSG